MNAFLLECLFPTGWRRTGEIFWRYSDALNAAQSEIKDSAARAVRILPVRISPDAVNHLEAAPAEQSEAC